MRVMSLEGAGELGTDLSKNNVYAQQRLYAMAAQTPPAKMVTAHSQKRWGLKMKMRVLIATNFILLNYNVILSQQGSFAGIVFDSLSSNPVAYASIWLEPGNIGTIADTAGRFLFSEIETGTYKIYTSHVGHNNFPGEQITIYPDSTIVLTMQLPGCPFFTLGKSDSCPKCGKSDQVVPIVYGKPTKKTIEREAKGEVKIAGCLIPDCAPNKYCKRDATNF